jgi:esterase/lipase
VTSPTLLIHSINDGFIPPTHLDLIAQSLGADEKETMFVEQSNHIITCDGERENVYQATREFILRREKKVG